MVETKRETWYLILKICCRMFNQCVPWSSSSVTKGSDSGSCAAQGNAEGQQYHQRKMAVEQMKIE